MSQLTIQNLAYSYDTSKFLNNINLTVNKGDKISVIGRNGAGKSTLLKLITKDLSPVSGFISYARNLSYQYIPQFLETDCENVGQYLFGDLWDVREVVYGNQEIDNKRYFEQCVFFEESNGYDKENSILKGIEKVDLSSDESFLYRKIDTLSGGEKTKLMFANAIGKQVDMYLIDEPTNHLDISMLKWLEDFINSSVKTFIIVSHDYLLMENTCEKIWYICDGVVRVENLSVSDFEKKMGKEQKTKIEQYKKKKEKIQQIEKALGDTKKKAVSFENFKRSRDIKKNGSYCKRDDGKYRAVRVQNTHKKIKTMNKRIDRISSSMSKPVYEREHKLYARESDLKSKYVAKLDNYSFAFDKKNLVLKNTNVFFENGLNYGIVGKNGSGKSTLLKLLNGMISRKEYFEKGELWLNPKVKFEYFGQEFENLDYQKSILDELTNGDKGIDFIARTILASMKFDEYDLVKKINQLSQGQKSKIQLIKTLIYGKDLLMLDEPTNHLEFESKKALINLLKQYTGTLILVSHDRFILEKVCDDFLFL